MIIIFIFNNDIETIKYYLYSLVETKKFQIYEINNLDQIREYFFNNLDNILQNDYIFVNIFNIIFFENLKLYFNINIYLLNYLDFSIKENKDKYINVYKKINISIIDLSLDNLNKININNKNKIYLPKNYTIYNAEDNIDLDKIKKYTSIFFKKIENNKNINNEYGFIVLRHINNENTNKLWLNSVLSIRRFYNNKIYVIDDNSDFSFISEDINYISDCELIKSEFPKRGELLPYYYLIKKKLFKKAIIIHDSTFLNKYIDFVSISDIKFLWHFTHEWDNDESEIKMINLLNNSDKIKELYYTKEKWYGCFGVQSIIDYDFLNLIQNKYNIFKLLDYIDSREKRMDLERIFSIISCLEKNNLYLDISLYGKIHHFIHWGYTYDRYEEDYKNNNIDNYDLIKVWSGR
tara:strand:+ start:20 stop:1237 length:1218 start_codon:yes stop_codon:yes gene_type:complete